jgi:hypothetical protein
MAEQDKTVKIPLFDGNKKNFVMWWTRFKAYGKVQQFAQALRETPEAALPATQVAYEGLDKADAANAAAVEATRRNELTWQWCSQPLRLWRITIRQETLTGLMD